MITLRKEITVKVSTETVKKRVVEYLVNESFKIKSDDGKIIIFEKGSIFRNHYTFNPRNWKSKVEVVLSRKENITTIWAKFEIDTIGQTVTNKEEFFWENCADRLEDAINGDIAANQLNVSEGKLTIKNNWSLILWAVLGAIIFIIPGIIVAEYTGTREFGHAFALSGALGLLFWKIRKDRNE
jgi:uncharacterized protein YxjI